ncbi:hypothetical protein AHMF7605_22980 [Adhaeribacter arboris]|uniref:Uncharacterized protein n=1 Tax=Adhaeribacter arboris TaxID=2072846 RepID=A0A2T2YKX8_9BACT|nr:hypothetical protein AHMF7605_22980 [Adhaeribacter arboris]
MEIFIAVTNYLTFVFIIIVPILLIMVLKRIKIKKFMIFYFLISLFVSGVLIWFSTWWGYESDLILLKQYGYNAYGMNNVESYGNVFLKIWNE